MAKSDGTITRLKKTLYKQGADKKKRGRSKLKQKRHDVSKGWGRQEAPDGVEQKEPKKKKKKGFSVITWIVLGALAFFVIASGVAAFLFLGGSNTLSTRNVEIEMAGPTSIDGGETVSLDISITNRNDRPIELADLIVEYPEGTRSAENIQVDLPRERISLGTIEPGERVTETVRAVIFGEADSTKAIDVSVEYRLEDSNAIFVSEGTYELGVTTAPLALSVEGLDEVVAGQETTFDITVTSHAESITEDVILQAQYPFGFSFSDSSPSPDSSENTWRLGDIEPGGERSITINGTLEGQEQEERTFRFSAGVSGENAPNELAIPFITGDHTLTVNRPFISLGFVFNGTRTNTYVANADEDVRVEVFWQNNTPDELFNTRIRLSLEGTALDPRSIFVADGFYNSNDNVITWSPDTISGLESVSPGQRGRFTFTFIPRDTTPAGTSIQEPRIDISADVESRRPGTENRVPETLTSSFERTVQVASGVDMLARTVYGLGPFTNAGPIPPRVGEQTTYTILWTANAGANAAADVVLSGSLPNYVEYTGTVDPTSANITYDENSRTVEWNVGDMESGARREAAFQVSITPALSQVGDDPELVNDQHVQGFDRFVGEQVETSISPQTTEMPTDGTVSGDEGDVIE